MGYNKIDIYYAKIQNLPIESLEEYLLYLPKDVIEKNKRYVRWQDRQANMLGKLLLIEWLKNEDYDPFILKDLKQTKYGRPFLDIDLDFNISHSGDYVVCAFTKDLRVGIDIEKIQENDLKSFKSVFTQNEYNSIVTSDNSLKKFYEYWTKKESIIKANGKGLSIPLKEIDLYNNQTKVNLYNEDWYLFELELHENYSIQLTSNKGKIQLKLTEINFY